MSDVVAEIREVDGQLVLIDPVAEAVIRVVDAHNKGLCRATFEQNADRVLHFLRRMTERGDHPDAICIAVCNVDDPHGGPIAEALMPGHEWQTYRDRGETPFARGLAGREFMQHALGLFDKAAASKLEHAVGRACVVVVDYGVAEVYVR